MQPRRSTSQGVPRLAATKVSDPPTSLPRATPRRFASPIQGSGISPDSWTDQGRDFRIRGSRRVVEHEAMKAREPGETQLPEQQGGDVAEADQGLGSFGDCGRVKAGTIR